MTTIHHFSAPVNTGRAPTHTYNAALSARFAPAKRYTIAGVTHPDGRPKILLMGDPRTRIGRNVRSSDAVHYTANTLNIRCDIIDQAHADGLLFIEICIDYRKSGTRKTFAASIETILAQGEKTYMDGCWQWALPKHLWLCDGELRSQQTSCRQPQAAPTLPKPEPKAAQPALFDFAEPVRRRGVY